MIKFVEGTDNKMIVTSDGKVFKRYSVSRKYPEKGFTDFREVNPSKDYSGYLLVGVRGCKTAYVHRLVAEAFIPKPLGATEVDHIDGDRTNNNLTNLRWVTHKENTNNPNTRWKGRKVWSNIQGFNPKSNHRTPIFTNLREASNWITPKGEKINPGSLVNYLNKKATYWNYFWTARLVTGEEYRKLLE